MNFKLHESKRLGQDELRSLVRMHSEPKQVKKRGIRRTLRLATLSVALSSTGACAVMGNGAVSVNSGPAGNYAIPTTSPTTTSPSSNVAYSTLGFYPGDGFHWSNFQNEEKKYNRAIPWALLYTDSGSPSKMLSSATWDMSGFSFLPPSGSALGRPGNVVESIPLAFDNMTLAQVAAGTADLQYTQAAQVIARVFPNAVIRPGWGFDGPWTPWAQSTNQQAFIAAYQRVSAIFKGVSKGFQIELCGDSGFQGNWTSANINALLKNTDIIGMAIYDNTSLTGLQNNLNWLYSFASSNNKKIGIPEWGLGTTDDPGFIQTMNTWFNSLGSTLAFNIYFDAKTSQLSTHPSSQAAFNQTFNTP